MAGTPQLLRQAVKDTMAVTLLSLALDDGTMGYAYVAMPTEKFPDFIQYYGGQALEWPDYATVLYQGEGEYPPAVIREWFFDTYGIES